MTMTITENIPLKKIGQFHYILAVTGGRYLSIPIKFRTKVRVHYEPGDYVAHQEAWARCITPICETRRDHWWRVALRRCGIKV